MSLYSLRKKLLKYPFFSVVVKKPYMAAQRVVFNLKAKKNIRMAADKVGFERKTILYLDIPIHPNMGDLAQYCCIKNWLKDNYSEYHVLEIDANSIMYARQEFISLLNKLTKEDLIFFQSGYCTQDLGGFHDEVHRITVENALKVPIIMLPQTVFFKSKENAARTAEVYSKYSNLTILLRDAKSFEYAKELFKMNRLMLCPDIVTSLIGTRNVPGKEERKGILLCCRNDSEKFYSDADISGLKEQLSYIDEVIISDTTVACDFQDLKKNISQHVSNMIDEFSHYRAIVTDRYHGTIFSLVAGTPLVVIKTNDHKVITGVDWFKDIYDETVCYEDDIQKVPQIVEQKYKSYQYEKLSPVFKAKYYDCLREKLEEVE